MWLFPGADLGSLQGPPGPSSPTDSADSSASSAQPLTQEPKQATQTQTDTQTQTQTQPEALDAEAPGALKRGASPDAGGDAADPKRARMLG